MTDDDALLRAVRAAPADDAPRLVYADWLDERGDPRGPFLRAQTALRPLPPDHPDRPAGEEHLSPLRLGLDPGWLAVVEPERSSKPTDPRGDPRCDCMAAVYSRRGTPRWPPPRFHREPQDTRSAGWQHLLDLIDQAAADGRLEFAPLEQMTGAERAQVVTLPPTIARLKKVRHLRLYRSCLVRLPSGIGEMESLSELYLGNSYRLHWFPYEIVRCPALRRSEVSTRALYGNCKYRPPFPRLDPDPTVPAATRPCSVCRRPFVDRQEHRVWVTLRVATDDLPLLVNACSAACVDRLPAPPDGYVPRPHRGGVELEQPPTRFW